MVKAGADCAKDLNIRKMAEYHYMHEVCKLLENMKKNCADESYEKYTGHGIQNTLKTLEHQESTGKRTWLRTVVVPGINDSEEIMGKYCGVVKNTGCIEKYELLAFHTMGFFKYNELNIENKLKGTPPLDISVRDGLQEFVNENLK